MTTYRLEASQCLVRTTVTEYTTESTVCTSAADVILQPGTPWTDGSWWIDHDGLLTGWADYPSADEVLLANIEAGLA